MKRIDNIKKATVNGRKVKLFDVWEQHNNAWIYAGKHSAPQRTANKHLLSYV